MQSRGHGGLPSYDRKIRMVFSHLVNLRKRLNRQLLLDTATACLALLIGALSLFLFAALYLSPRAFLYVILALAVAVLGGLAYATVLATYQWADLVSAARVADRRANLKERLTTLVTMEKASESLPLWPFLVEDVHQLRDFFTPFRIAPWRAPRSLLALVAACVLALLAFLALKSKQAEVSAQLAAQASSKVTQVEPIFPNLFGNYSTTAKAGGRQFSYGQEGDRNGIKVESSNPNEDAGQQGSLWAKLSAQADRFARSLQNELTGRPQEPLSAESSADSQSTQSDSSTDAAKEEVAREESSQNSTMGSAGKGSSAGESTPERQGARVKPGEVGRPDSSTQRPDSGQAGRGLKSANPSQGSSESEGWATTEQASRQDEMTYGQVGKTKIGPHEKGSQVGIGASHGFGADPEHLYGRAEKAKSPSHTFRITLQGSESGMVAGSGKPYRPPKADIPLNPSQAPDEPIYRADISPEQREIIKRAFEP